MVALRQNLKLGEVLVNKKLLTIEQIQFVLSEQRDMGKKLGELLLEKNLVGADELNLALQEQYWRRNGYWVIG